MKRGDKNFLLLLLLVGLVQCNSLKCPRYCSCFVSHDGSLKTVECIAKQLTNIDLGIPFEVQSLDLSNNSISILDDRGFSDLGLLDLVELYLRFNTIRSIGLQAFAGLSHLRHLDLTGNHLYHIIPWTFHDNPYITQLILQNNPIGHNAEGILLDAPNLQVLDISNCHFAHLPNLIFTQMLELQIVNISGNQLIGLDVGEIDSLKMLRIIDISRNPWPCDINMKQVEDWLNSRSVQLIGSSCDIDSDGDDVQKSKLEKMISIVENDEEEDLDKNWTKNEKCLNISSSCTCETYNISNFDKIKLNIPSPWIFVIGFQFGMLFALFAGFLWASLKHTKKTVGNQLHTVETQPIIMVAPACPETPPPTYRELYCS